MMNNLNSRRLLRIKPTAHVFKAPGLIFFRSSSNGFEITDETGIIADVVDRLDGCHTEHEIFQSLLPLYGNTAKKTIEDIIHELDELYLLEDAKLTPPAALDEYSLERWSRNLGFLGSYCRVHESKYEKQCQIMNSRIALFGLGGLGSHILYDLVAFGFSNIRAVDFDKVELANLNRQILYSEVDIGRQKTDVAAERIGQFSRRANVEFVEKRISSMADVAALIEGRDAVVCVADKPTFHIGSWLNEACVNASIPFITGGLDNQRATYYTVVPGETGCTECWKISSDLNSTVSSTVLSHEVKNEHYASPQPAVVPLVSVLTGLIVAELIRLITQISPVVAANCLHTVDFATMQTSNAETWDRNPKCQLCSKI